jgi:hypothetical protein
MLPGKKKNNSTIRDDYTEFLLYVLKFVFEKPVDLKLTHFIATDGIAHPPKSVHAKNKCNHPYMHAKHVGIHARKWRLILTYSGMNYDTFKGRPHVLDSVYDSVYDFMYDFMYYLLYDLHKQDLRF